MLVISLKALLDGSGVYDVPGVGRPLDERLSLPQVLALSVEECWPIPATWPNTGYRRLLPLPLAELFAAIRTMVLLPPYHISISTSPLYHDARTRRTTTVPSDRLGPTRGTGDPVHAEQRLWGVGGRDRCRTGTAVSLW